MAVTVAGGFGDSSHGTMRTSHIGSGMVCNVYDITLEADVSATTALPTTLTKLIYAHGTVTVSGAVSTAQRVVTAASICSSGPWLDVSIADISTAGQGPGKFMAIGW